MRAPVPVETSGPEVEAAQTTTSETSNLSTVHTAGLLLGTRNPMAWHSSPPH